MVAELCENSFLIFEGTDKLFRVKRYNTVTLMTLKIEKM